MADIVFFFFFTDRDQEDFFKVGAQFVAECRQVRNVTLANLWIECLQFGNDLN